MHPTEDFDLGRPLPPQAEELVQDLELDTLMAAMAEADDLVFDVARHALLLGLPEPETIAYRQAVLADCRRHPEVIGDLYRLAGDALAARKTVWRSLARDTPGAVTSHSVQVLELLHQRLHRLHRIASDRRSQFTSPGFTRLFTVIAEQLDDDYLAQMQRLLSELRFDRGQLISARLGPGNHGTGYTLRPAAGRGWLRHLRLLDRTGYTFTIPERDYNGFQALGELQDEALVPVAQLLGQAADHVVGFFRALRTELAFYVGCLRLERRLTQRGLPTCVPIPVAAQRPALSAVGLYDPCLALTSTEPIVGNDLDADGRRLVMITGANQGGKSTLLRAIGVAQLMTQAGMFAPAQWFRCDVAAGVFTHFRRGEDEQLQSGKLDDELRRMSAIADLLRPGSMLLCNESFASTNEREGSQIAGEVIRALTEEQVKVLFVTHQFELASGLHRIQDPATLFLRAARGEAGGRTYQITEAPPLPTSYGQDSFRRVFGRDPAVDRYAAGKDAPDPAVLPGERRTGARGG